MEIIGGLIGLLAAGIGIYIAIKFTIGVAFRTKPNPDALVLPAHELKSKFLLLGRKNPFDVMESPDKDFDIQVRWEIVDAKWREILGKAWKNLTYTAYISFDEEKKAVKYYERLIEKDISMAPLRIEKESYVQKGFQIDKRIRSFLYGIKEDGSIGEVYSYDFNPNDIKGVMRQIANENGWFFELHLSRRGAKKK